MWHSRRSYLALLYFLLEIVHGYISPHISAEINQNVIDSFHTVKLCSKHIVMFNLCGKLLALQAKFFFNKFICEFNPVLVWKSNLMRIKITCRSSELSHERNLYQKFDLVLNAFNKYHHFFA